MSTATRKRHLQAVPPSVVTINADLVAFTVMEYIDTHFPEVWQNVPRSARVNIRHTIVSAVLTEDAKR